MLELRYSYCVKNGQSLIQPCSVHIFGLIDELILQGERVVPALLPCCGLILLLDSRFFNV